MVKRVDAPRKYINLSKKHVHNGVRLKKGAIFESDQDLVRIHGENKFRYYRDPGNKTSQEIAEQVEDEDDVNDTELNHEKRKKNKQDKVKKKAKLTNVTEAFPDADKVDMVVFRDNDDNYFVAEKDEPKKLLNKKPLVEGEVLLFIEEHK